MRTWRKRRISLHPEKNRLDGTHDLQDPSSPLRGKIAGVMQKGFVHELQQTDLKWQPNQPNGEVER